MTGIMDSLLKTSEWLMRLVWINTIWLLFNIPVVYLLLDIVFRNSAEEAFTLLIFVIVLIPFLSFPATTAMFALMRRWIMGKGTNRLFSHYWKFYKQNYFRSIIASIPFMLLWFLWVMNYRFTIVEVGSLIFYVYLFVAIIFFTLTNYSFADRVHFEIGLFASLQKTVFMTIFYIHYTLGAACATIIVVGLLYVVHPILLVLFVGSTISYIYFFAYYQIYLKAKDKQEQELDKDN